MGQANGSGLDIRTRSNMIDIYYLSIPIGLALVGCGYLIGRHNGISLGAENMFEQLEEMGIIETSTVWEDGEQQTYLMKDGKRVDRN